MIQIDLNAAIELAGKFLGYGDMVSSARLCLEDAVALRNSGDLQGAKTRALKSIAYSVGIAHPAYRQVSAVPV